MSRAKGIYTIGFKGLAPEEFVDLLVENKIDLLLDVRFRPRSRIPGFSKTKLSNLLSSKGIDYQHEQDLGTPPEILREVWRRGGYYAEGFKDYRPHLKTKVRTLKKVAKMISNKRTCLMSYERDNNRCHRTVVAEKLAELTGGKINHLRC